MTDPAALRHNQQLWARLEALGLGQRFLYYFTQLSSIPRGSGNTGAVSAYCAEFAREHHLRYIQDSSHNIIMYKDGTPGYQDHPTVILQGHLDMVCVSTPECTLDLDREGLRLCTDGEWLWADGTTLGADDGIAVAYALAILESDQLRHPPLEVVFTTDEETGMDGAHALDGALLQGRVLLNLDSEEEGLFTAGCSGGSKRTITLPVRREAAEGALLDLEVSGLLGGHSGTMIAAGRANACVLLAQLLHRLDQAVSMRLVSCSGGEKDNAIPAGAKARLLVPREDLSKAEEEVRRHQEELRRTWAAGDPGLRVDLRSSGAAADCQALDRPSTARLIHLLCALPNGVQAMMRDIPGLPQTSCNLGVLRLEEERALILISVRSSVKADCLALSEHIGALALEQGAASTVSGAYPPWEYRAVSPLRETVARVYPQVRGSAAQFNVIHAGLECGILYEKLPGLDALSFGPTILDIHTPGERFQFSSALRTWNFLLKLLEAL